MLPPFYTAILRKVLGKSARGNPQRYCGWLWGHCSSKKFERMVREGTDICLRILKERNKSRFDSFSRYKQCIDHIPYYLSGLSPTHFFWKPFYKQLYIGSPLSISARYGLHLSRGVSPYLLHCDTNAPLLTSSCSIYTKYHKNRWRINDFPLPNVKLR